MLKEKMSEALSSVLPVTAIVLILTHQDKRNAIMESVNEDCGMKTKAGAVIMSLGIEELAKLS